MNQKPEEDKGELEVPTLQIQPNQPPIKGNKKQCRCRVVLKANPEIRTINGIGYFDYLKKSVIWSKVALRPLEITNQKIGFSANMNGGGLGSASVALSLALAKAIVAAEPTFKPVLKKAGLLKVDSRRVLQKIAGRPKARKKRQRSKR